MAAPAAVREAAGAAAARDAADAELLRRLDEAGSPALPSPQVQQSSLALAELPPSRPPLEATLQDVTEQRERASTAEGALLIEGKAPRKAGDDVLARRALLPGTAADLLRCAQAALTLHQVAAAAPAPPEPRDTTLRIPFAKGDDEAALSHCAAPRGGWGAAATLAERDSVTRRATPPSDDGPWALVALNNAVRVYPLGELQNSQLNASGLRPGRAFLLAAEVREVLVHGAGASTAYVSVARGGSPLAPAEVTVCRVAEKKAAALPVGDPAQVACLPPP
eukprot:gene4524-8011_t